MVNGKLGFKKCCWFEFVFGLVGDFRLYMLVIFLEFEEWIDFGVRGGVDVIFFVFFWDILLFRFFIIELVIE